MHDATYSYDDIGNRSQTIINGQTINYTINQLNQYTAIGSKTLGYNANGCLTALTVSGTTTTYAYDYENRLTTVEKANGDDIEFVYDALGRRISKILTPSGESAIITHYVYNGDQVVMELDESYDTVASYYYGIGLDEPLYRVDDQANIMYYHSDLLGSTTEITDESENIDETIEYDAYGNFITAPSSYDASYFFTGRRYDPETGLYYYRNRYYNPELGRFLTPDPARFIDGPNLYTYVRNNPVNWVDPYGLCSDDKEEENSESDGDSKDDPAPPDPRDPDKSQKKQPGDEANEDPKKPDLNKNEKGKSQDKGIGRGKRGSGQENWGKGNKGKGKKGSPNSGYQGGSGDVPSYEDIGIYPPGTVVPGLEPDMGPTPLD